MHVHPFHKCGETYLTKVTNVVKIMTDITTTEQNMIYVMTKQHDDMLDIMTRQHDDMMIVINNRLFLLCILLHFVTIIMLVLYCVHTPDPKEPKKSANC